MSSLSLRYAEHRSRHAALLGAPGAAWTGRLLRPGQFLFWEGDRGARLYTLAEGAMRTVRLSPSGMREIVDFLFPGDVFGVCADQLRVYTAEALVLTQITIRPGEPDDSAALLETTTAELTRTRTRAHLLSMRGARERVAGFLLDLAQRQGWAFGTPLWLPMTRTDMADYLGLTLETVCRSLSGFKRDGYVDLPDLQSLVLHDADALAHLADIVQAVEAVDALA